METLVCIPSSNVAADINIDHYIQEDVERSHV